MKTLSKIALLSILTGCVAEINTMSLLTPAQIKDTKTIITFIKANYYPNQIATAIETIKYLDNDAKDKILDKGFVDVAREWTNVLLIDAARKGKSDVIEALVRKGADVNEEDLVAKELDDVGVEGIEGGWTPLHYATDENQDIRVIKTLVECGADPKRPNCSEDTPLDFANRSVLKAESIELKHKASAVVDYLQLVKDFYALDQGLLKMGDFAKKYLEITDPIRSKQNWKDIVVLTGKTDKAAKQLCEWGIEQCKQKTLLSGTIIKNVPVKVKDYNGTKKKQ